LHVVLHISTTEVTELELFIDISFFFYKSHFKIFMLHNIRSLCHMLSSSIASFFCKSIQEYSETHLEMCMRLVL